MGRRRDCCSSTGKPKNRKTRARRSSSPASRRAAAGTRTSAPSSSATSRPAAATTSRRTCTSSRRPSSGSPSRCDARRAARSWRCSAAPRHTRWWPWTRRRERAAGLTHECAVRRLVNEQRGEVRRLVGQGLCVSWRVLKLARTTSSAALAARQRRSH